MNLHARNARTLSSSIKSLKLPLSQITPPSTSPNPKPNLPKRIMDPDTPQKVLLILMSFLTFRDAARTAVLSKYWRNVWRQSTNVELNENFFSYVGEDNKRAAFVNFIHNWLAHHQPRVLDQLSIVASRPLDSLLLRFTIGQGVKNLGLDFSDPKWGDEELLDNKPNPSFDLPMFLYDHEAIESLSLVSCNIKVASMINFRALKQLTLGWIEVPRETISTLLENLVLLESLSLKNCWNAGGLQIVGRDLKLLRLYIDKLVMSEYHYLEIDAPNLKWLKYSGQMVEFQITAEKLVDACFDFGLEKEGDEQQGVLLYDLLYQLPAKILTVCTYMLQILPLEFESNGVQPMFGMRKLTLKTAMHTCEQKGIQYLLASCPSLETLIIDIVVPRIIEVDEDDAQHDVGIWTRSFGPEYHCLNQNLKQVAVRGFRGTAHEIEFARHLISRGRVLKKMYIMIGKELFEQRSPGENRRLINQMFPRVVRQMSDEFRLGVFVDRYY